MPCYTEYAQAPSRAEYAAWRTIGYLGSWDDYCRAKKHTAGGQMFLCGDLGPGCADCGGVGDFACDFPVGDGKTCDRPMCREHAHEISPEIHYCDGHYRMWREFRDAGGVDAALRNVVAFKTES